MFGESHLWHINRKRFSNSLPKCRTRLKYFSKTKDLEYYVTLTLDEEKPDIAVIHILSTILIFDSYVITLSKTLEKILSILVKNIGRVGFLK